MDSSLPPIESSRLSLRRPQPNDAPALHARRNDPRVAEYQDWTLPYELSAAEELVADAVAGPGAADGWHMLTITDRGTAEILGDVAIGLSWDQRCAEIGYTLAPDHWGKGYATEAAAAVIPHLFDTVGVTRVHGQLHPDNIASARVFERLGFVFEGRTRLSFWVGDENSDDAIYGLTRADWDHWNARPTGQPSSVELVDIGPGNARRFDRLRTHKTDERFVAPVLASYADALIPELVDGAPVVPWFRGVQADGEAVGFVMLAEITAAHAEPYLWRLLIDRHHQRRGIGTAVLDLVISQCAEWSAATILTSWVEGAGSPRGFYERYGFVPTGRIVDGETEAGLALR